jgi:predicted transcriptional regulator
MSIGPVDIEFVLKGDIEGDIKKVSSTVKGEAKAMAQQVDGFTESTQQSQKGVKGLVNQISEAPGPIGQTVSAIGQMTKAALAFIATPIGAVIAAIVVGLKALTTWFRSSEEGENALSQTTAIFKQVMESLLDPVEKVGEWLYKAFTKPKDAARDLVDFLRGQVINRLEAVGDAARAIMEILNGNFKSGFSNLGNAFSQSVTGIKDSGDRMLGFFADAAEKTKQRVEYARQLNEFEKKDRDFSIEREKANTRIAELRFAATDLETPEKTRLGYMRQAAAEVEKLYNKEIDLATEKYTITKGIQELDDQTIADKRELAGLETNVIRLQGQKAMELKSLSRQTNSLAKAVAKESIGEVEAMQQELDKLHKDILNAEPAQRKAIAERILLLEGEILKRQELARLALTEAMGGTMPGKMKSIATPQLFDRTPAAVKETTLDLEKMKKKIKENTEAAKKMQEELSGEEAQTRLMKFVGISEQVLDSARQLTSELSAQLNLSEEQSQVVDDAIDQFDALTKIAKGDYIGGITQLISTWAKYLIKTPDLLSEKFTALNENVNKLINSLTIAAKSSDSALGASFAVTESTLLRLNKEAKDLNESLFGKVYGGRLGAGSTSIARDNTIQTFKATLATYEDLKKEIDKLVQRLLQGNLSDDQRKAIEAVLESYNALTAKLDEITMEITGTTAQTLAESLSSAFLAGEDAAEAWGDKVDEIIKTVITKQLTAQLLADPIKKAIDQLVKDTEGGLDITEAESFRNAIKSISEAVGPAFSEARKALEGIGINLEGTNSTAFSGAIRGITEETGGMIAGQMMGIRFDVKNVIAEMLKNRQSFEDNLTYMAEIAKNTRHNYRLEAIETGITETNRILKEKL